MTAWTTIGNAALLVGKKITSSLGMALRDNPIAIAEDASGAPKIKRRVRAAGSSTSVTFTGLGEYGGVVMDIDLLTGAGPGTYTLELEFSNDGTTWLPGAAIYSTTTSAVALRMRLAVDFDGATYSRLSSAGVTSGTATGASLSAVSMRLRASAASFAFGVMAEFNGGLT